jgi:YD repeat-containing protein
VTYMRGPDGQIERVVATDGLGRLRKVRVGYDPAERIFPTTMTNGLGHVTRTDYHPGLGVLVAARDENGVTTRWHYDRLGRLRDVVSPDGGNVSLSYGVGTGAGLGYPLEVLEVAAGGGRQITTFDLHGRPVLQRATAAENTSPQLSFVSVKYDGLGRLASVSRPYFEGETPVETTYAYFRDGLLRTETHPGAGTVTSSYRLLGDLFQIQVTDARGHDSVQRVNGLGQVRLTREIEPQTCAPSRRDTTTVHSACSLA